MAFDNKLLEVIACPVSKGKLILNKEKTELLCLAEKLAYPIEDGIPVLIADKARVLSSDEVDSYR